MKKLLLIWLSSVAVVAAADFRLGTPFSNGAVLQRNTQVAVWGVADAGATVKVTFAGQTPSAVAAADGTWRISLAPMKESREGRQLVAESNGKRLVVDDVVVGEVWLASGQSNMSFAMKGVHPRNHDRLGGMALATARRPCCRYINHSPGPTVAPVKFGCGNYQWRHFVTEELNRYDISAVSFWFAMELYNALEIPIGIICISRGATDIETWTPREGIEQYRANDKMAWIAEYPVVSAKEWKPTMKRFPVDQAMNQPTVLWNSGWASIVPYTARGMIWYQGEHNNRDGALYAEKLRILHESWAKQFENENFKFYFAQLAPYGRGREMQNWFGGLPLVQQDFAKRQKNASIAILNDVGQLGEIHPWNKQIVGKRLALKALKYDYGFDLECESPIATGWKAMTNGIVRVELDHAKDLYVYNEDVVYTSPFEILDGQDNKWKPAKIAEFKLWRSWNGKNENRGFLFDGHIDVVAEGVTNPKGVRYACVTPFKGNVYNGTDLPLGAFELK